MDLKPNVSNLIHFGDVIPYIKVTLSPSLTN